MTDALLTAILAERVLGWGVGPERFTVGKGKWLSRWKFKPAEKLEDALRLLEAAILEEYEIQGDGTGPTHVRVRIAGTAGEATEASKARAITHAIARAVGIQVEP